MKLRALWLCVGGFLLMPPVAAVAYPGGTAAFQTDAAPYCSGCHSSRTVEMLTGAPEGRAEKEWVDNKHLPLIEKGEGGYAELDASQRSELIRQIQALDAASTITLDAPSKVAAGETFLVRVSVTGGAGPVVGIALVDGEHRWLARPAPSAGWQVAAPPVIRGQDGAGQTAWLDRRPEALDRNLAYVNVSGIASDASESEWGHAEVVWRLAAPRQPGVYPLGAVYWYGTEKGTPLGHTVDPIRGKQVRGGFTGHSGRILFAPLRRVTVE
ncbi:MAG: hypothetical protein ABFS46_15775 [Myxococcota bacterium]